MSSRQQQLQEQIMRDARHCQMQMMAAQQQRDAQARISTQDTMDGNSVPPQSQAGHIRTMGSALDDVPIQPADYDPNSPIFDPARLSAFESACRDGPQSAVASMLNSTSTPYFLHHGLESALSAGNAPVVAYLLSVGAPIARATPSNILISAPRDKQIPLFELLSEHGWTPNTPGLYGEVLLPQVVKNPLLLKWFLDHGANPNLGAQRDSRDRLGPSDTKSCAALEAAAAHADLSTVRLLLDAGAEISNGYPLHSAAGACPPNTNPHQARVQPSKEFDKARIPVMEELVKRGADVNQKLESRYMEPRWAVELAVMAGAVERVGWLLERGADPERKGKGVSAREYAEKLGSEEMKKVMEEGTRART
ncbi:MAG: hypothetical protein M1821_007002 [Bathelium mastoideum]|nr:MAG: hypothetical protein M1821_007002 [Bathelium mastoideum]